MLWADRHNSTAIASRSLITKICDRIFGGVGSVGGVAKSGAKNPSRNSITDQCRVVTCDTKCRNNRLHNIFSGTLGIMLHNKPTNCLDRLPRRQRDGQDVCPTFWNAHPENVLGEHTLAGTMYRSGDYAAVAPPGQDTAALIRETELAELFPIHVVRSWLGNSEGIARKHYLQTTDQHIEKAVCGNP